MFNYGEIMKSKDTYYKKLHNSELEQKNADKDEDELAEIQDYEYDLEQRKRKASPQYKSASELANKFKSKQS
jgi:hypothetical protein